MVVGLMKVGDRVTQSPMWKHKTANGTIIKVTKDGYYVISWDDINGDWYYTEEQMEAIVLLDRGHVKR